jgi:hypothetical protein
MTAHRKSLAVGFGNGSEIVNLIVTTAQIVGRHTVCLATIAPTRHVCAIGPGTFSLVPPAHVVGITINTPIG